MDKPPKTQGNNHTITETDFSNPLLGLPSSELRVLYHKQPEQPDQPDQPERTIDGSGSQRVSDYPEEYAAVEHSSSDSALPVTHLFKDAGVNTTEEPKQEEALTLLPPLVHADDYNSEELPVDAKEGESSSLSDSTWNRGFYKQLAEARQGLPQAKRPPITELRFRNLTYKVKVRAPETAEDGISYVQRIPTFWTSCEQLLFFWRPVQIQQKIILKKLNGVFKPGTMTVLMGPPGSGKSTLLKALAGNIAAGQVSGKITFNDVPADELILPRLVGYVDQVDKHLPLFTVKETLNFASRCLNGKNCAKEGAILGSNGGLGLQTILRILGLEHVANTIIGNEIIRGISGGQRKRVSVAEMLVSSRSVLLLDEISTGLDSVTTFEIVHAIQALCKIFRLTVVISLLQPPPEVFSLFDDVLLLAKGQIVYHGPQKKVLAYFGSLGYDMPYMKDQADFLQEVVVNPSQFLRRGEESVAPQTSAEFARRWLQSPFCTEMVRKVTQPWAEPKDDEGGPLHSVRRNSPEAEQYACSYWENQNLVTKRQLQLLSRDKVYLKIRAMQLIVMGILAGTVYYQMPLDNYILRYGVIYYAVLFLSLGNMTTVPTIMRQRDIFYKQNQNGFFRGSNWSFALLAAHILIALFEAIVLGVLLYWFSGLTAEAGRFFFFIFGIFSMAICLTSFFRLMAFVLPNVNVAQPLAICMLVVAMVFAGFLITENKINNGWIWVYWINPLSWLLRSLSLNEFTASKFDATTDTGERLGNVYLQAFGVRTEGYWQWAGIGYQWGFFLLTIIGQILALKYLRYDGSSHPNIPEEKDKNDPFEVAEKEDHKIEVHSSLPFTPMTISFEDIGYSVTAKKGKLELLSGVGGYMKPGRMIALMGESGAGKTTLLDVLAGRKNMGVMTGKILVNGVEVAPTDFKNLVGYVEQMDIHIATATIREALEFSAALRLAGVEKSRQLEFVGQVLDILELTPIADVLIGTPGHGLSSEQRKRVTIGVELVANPPIIFLDEPTSGLDSRAAAVVVRAISNISKTGRTVICTVHQPSRELFSQFDDLLLLKRGGKIVFFGELGSQSESLIQYLETFPDVHKFDPSMNPANWMLEVLSDENSDFGTRYIESDLKRRADAELKHIRKSAQTTFKLKPRFATPVWVQQTELLKRFYRSYWRTPSYTFVRVVVQSVVGLFFGTVFYKLSDDSVSGIHSKVSLIYIANIFSAVLNLNTVLGVAMEDRAVYYRERAAKTYSVNTFATAMTIAEIPYLIVTSLLFVSIMYFMVGFRNSVDAFFFYWLNFLTFGTMMTFMGQFFACVLPNAQTAQILSSSLFSVWNLFSGFLVPKPDIPVWWEWLYYISPAQYVLNAMASDQYYCEGDNCPRVSVVQGTSTVVQTKWDYVRTEFDFNYNHRWTDFAIVVAFVVAFRVGTYLALKYISHLRR